MLPVAYKESVRALIVDDNPANRHTLQRMLKHLCVESVAVNSGIEALCVTSNHSFQAIFMDLQMPGLDGYDTTRALREAGTRAPIFADTGNHPFLRRPCCKNYAQIPRKFVLANEPKRTTIGDMVENDLTAASEIGTNPAALLDGFVPGQVLGGKYKVISLLGRGGMGTVYLVQQVFLNKKLALKTLNKLSVSDVTLQRFQLEAKAASSIKHPNLVEVHDFGLLDDGQPYLVMEFIEGASLADFLKQKGSMSMEDARPIFVQACFGLLAAHEKGIVHRDIKPGNIMILKNRSMDADGSVKVVDFGIAKLTNRETGEIQALTRTGDIFGSPLYMSPEQCVGGVVDHRSDIYSLGCVLYEMLTGTPPHVGQNALITMKLHESGQLASLKEASMGKQFPDALEQVVAKMLSKSPGQRYQNVGLVAHDLSSVCKGRAIADLRPVEKTAKHAKVISMSEQRFLLIMLSIVLFTAVASGMGGYVYKQSQLTQPQIDQAVTTQTGALTARLSTAKVDHDSELSPGPALADFQLDFVKKQNKDKSQLAQFGQIQSTLINDGKDKQFEFPSCGIGSLCEIKDSDKHKELCLAQGKVTVPADVPLMLKIQGVNAIAVLETPSFFSKINPIEFSGLVLTRPRIGNQDEKSTKDNSNKNVEAILKTVAEWPQMQVLMVNDLPINETAFAYISKLNALKRFRMSGSELHEANPAKLTFLKRLSSVTLEGIKHVDDIIHILANSDNLKNLDLFNCEVSMSTLRELQRLPRLSIQEDTFDDSLVESVIGLPKLIELGIFGKLTMKQLVTLSKCPHFKHIVLIRKMYSADEKSALTHMSSKFVFRAEKENLGDINLVAF